jgi:hypothetical protein
MYWYPDEFDEIQTDRKKEDEMKNTEPREKHKGKRKKATKTKKTKPLGFFDTK